MKCKPQTVVFNRSAYECPKLEYLSVDTPLSLLESLSLGGDVHDFVDDGNLELEDYYPIIH